MAEHKSAARFRVIEYPFHIGDLVGGTTNLDDSQFGAYMRLLIANIQAGVEGLPDNEERLRSYTRMGPAAWRKFWNLVGDKFVRENGKIYHPRVKETVNGIINKSDIARANRLKCIEKGLTDVIPPSDDSATNPKTRKPENQESQKRIPNPDSDKNPARGQVEPKDSGFLIRGLDSGSGFRIDHHLRDQARASVRKFAPGWDIYNLMSEYDAWIADKGQRPDNPEAGFIAWVKKKTGGNPPK